MGPSWKKFNEELFETGKYKYTDSVSEMLQSLGWPTLEARKRKKISSFYKIANKIACIQTGSIWIPVTVEQAYKG